MVEIIGHGDIASALFKAAESSVGLKEGRVYIAAGVSNPNPLPESEYQREKELLIQLAQRKDLQDLQVVYLVL